MIDKMIRKFYFRDWTEQITYSIEEAVNVLENTDKEIDHMDRLDKENIESDSKELPF